LSCKASKTVRAGFPRANAPGHKNSLQHLIVYHKLYYIRYHIFTKRKSRFLPGAGHIGARFSTNSTPCGGKSKPAAAGMRFSRRAKRMLFEKTAPSLRFLREAMKILKF
jgi:hypothetical protein